MHIPEVYDIEIRYHGESSLRLLIGKKLFYFSFLV